MSRSMVQLEVSKNDEQPPSYLSTFTQIRDAQNESKSKYEFCKKLATIIYSLCNSFIKFSTNFKQKLIINFFSRSLNLFLHFNILGIFVFDFNG